MRFNAFRWLLLALLSLLIAACAARGPSPHLLSELGQAQVLLREGCYRCLVDALAAFERVAAAPRAPVSAVQGAFETAVMLSVRAKEIGLDADEFLAKARAFATRMPPVAGAPAPATYLDAAAAFIGETSGLDPEVRQKLPRRRSANGRPLPLPARTALDAAPASDALAGYLAIALDCEETFSRADLHRDDLFAKYGRTQPMRFRLALCNVAPAELIPLREADQRWSETLLFEGRRQLATRPVADVLKAAALFDEAHKAFPGSPAITLALAGAENALSNYDAALALYDEVLAETPTHRDAMLGRLTSLSFLNRYVDAVTTATAMIDLGTWHIGDAYYWRAWNRYQLHQLPTAWEDIEQATKLLVNTSVYTLAGFIAYARVELDIAIDRFDRAFAMDHTNCEAVWFEGLVHVDKQGWPQAAPKFSRAMTCFASAAATARTEIDTFEQSTTSEVLRTRQLAAAQKRLETAEHRGAQAAYNAANSYLRLAEKILALGHIDAALGHPLLKEKAASLKATIEKIP